MIAMTSSVVIVHIYPSLLGLYGDRGNALVLLDRAHARGIPAELLEIEPGETIPEQADIYLIGGGEDLAQVTATNLLRSAERSAAIRAEGAVVLAVCAGLQMLGTEFRAAGQQVRGLGLVDAVTTVGPDRAVGELVTEPEHLPIPTLTGFENHAGRTALGPGVMPLGRVIVGIGNGDVEPDSSAGERVDGFIHDRIVATYLHGPVLARNPALADLLLRWATGGELATLEDRTAEALRNERLAATLSSRQVRRASAASGRRTELG